ncbi:DUF3168 domain-containing protein [Rhizobium sp. 18055]|uniref:DUF3168 domain-containing protein n=1 Tax=Rhizobium sp. 18055 TaxID=2681403 RepID=UPI001357F3E7|nr:DUF3168 domain-containing protein [Rhizobium sp. 18055]
MSAANELLTAICARLAADAELTALIGADGIRDRLVSGRKLPSIVIGDWTVSDYSTATEQSDEHRLTLEIWTDAAGRRQTEIIAARLHALLHDRALDLEGHHLVSLLYLLTQTRREPKTRLHVAEMRFRAVTE